VAVEYKLQFYDRDGTPHAGSVVNFLRLDYSSVVDDVGLALIDLPQGHAEIDLEWDGQIDILWRDVAAGIDWLTDFYGVYVDQDRRADVNGLVTTTMICEDANTWLNRSVVAYRANVLDRSQFYSDPVETIAKTLATYNATAAGTTADGRVDDVDAWGANISVEADGAAGTVRDFACSGRPLLNCLQDLAISGDAWEFRWYDGQLGTDRSGAGPNRITFALNYNNMATPVLRRNRRTERTKAFVAGQGQEGARTVEVRTGANYEALYGSREIWVDRRDLLLPASLQAAGDERLAELQARNELTFAVKQSSGRRYGRDYFHGDKVIGFFEGITDVKQIVSTSVVVAAGGDDVQQIVFGLRDV